MDKRYTKHKTFVIEKNYPHAPEQVYAAWANPEAKAKWYPKADSYDFRVGGHEKSQGTPPGGPTYTFDACYQDIVPNACIVYTYTMDMDDIRISASITTVEFQPFGEGTKLVYTEQGVFMDGHDTPEQREHGTNILLDKLGEALSP